MLPQENVSISDCLAEAFVLWKKHFKRIALICIAVYLPAQLLIEVAENIMGPPDFSSAESVNRYELQIQVYNTIRTLVGWIAFLAIIKLSLEVVRQRDQEEVWTQYLNFGFQNWIKYLGVAIQAALITIAYLLLLIIPGIYKGVRFSFVDCCFVDEDERPLDYSEAIVENNWFRVFGLLILLVLIGIGIELSLLYPVRYLPESIPLVIAFGVLVQVISSYTIVAKAVYYYRARELKLKAEKTFEEQEGNKDQ